MSYTQKLIKWVNIKSHYSKKTLICLIQGSKNYACSEEDFNRRLDIYKKNYDKQVCDLQNEVQRLLSDNCLLQPFKLKFEVLETEFHQRLLFQ